MKKPLFNFVFCALVCLNPGPPIEADDRDTETHELTGPVKVLWEAHYDGPASGSDYSYSIAVTPDNSTVVVTGSSPGEPSPGYISWGCATIAYDTAAGEQIWAARYDNPAASHARSIDVSPNGVTVFVTGLSGGAFTWDYVTFAYDAVTGEESWMARYDGSGSDEAEAIAVSPDGSTVFVTGGSDGRFQDYTTIAYDATTGEELWVARYNWVYQDQASAMAVSPDGSTVFVTGTSSGTPDREYATVAYATATGEELWVARYGRAYLHPHTSAIAVGPDGSTVFVTGTTWGDYGAVGNTTVAYATATGEELWVARRDSGFARSVTVSPSGATVFVTGAGATIAYDASTGEELWTSGGSNLIAVTPDGSLVVVAGNPWTVGYDSATGEEVWRVYADSFEATSIALSSDGSMAFVTGRYRAASIDYATFAYLMGRTIESDIKPSVINPYQRGVVPVVILGSQELDVTEIDVTTLRFGPNEAPTKHDLTDDFSYNDHLEDMNLDGHMDLMTHFETQETGIACGDTEASLSGSLIDGIPIEGTDTFRTVGCNSNRTPRPSATNERTGPLQEAQVQRRRPNVAGTRDD